MNIQLNFEQIANLYFSIKFMSIFFLLGMLTGILISEYFHKRDKKRKL